MGWDESQETVLDCKEARSMSMPDMELTYATELQVTKAEREKGPEMTYDI